MKRYVAFLRGINIGGRKKVLMVDLRDIFQTNGFEDIKTYIQTGNVSFTTKKKEDEMYLSAFLEKTLFNYYGFEIPVVVLSLAALKLCVEGNPFIAEGESDIDRFHVTLLKQSPEIEASPLKIVFYIKPKSTRTSLKIPSRRLKISNHISKFVP